MPLPVTDKKIKRISRLNPTTYKFQIGQDGYDDDVVVGDIAHPDFKPRIALTRWKWGRHPVTIDIALKTGFDVPGIHRQDGEKVKWETPDFDFDVYGKEPQQVGDAASGERGELELELILKKRPPTRRFEWFVNAPDLDFFLQPRIDAGAIAEERSTNDGIPIDWSNPEWVARYYNPNDRKEGYTETDSPKGIYRPSNVIGSYAVFHKTKSDAHKDPLNTPDDLRIAGTKSKAGHFFYPYLRDANGWVVRADDFKIENGVMRVDAPQEFLDNAVYPVIIDPTFGYTTVGGSQATIAYNGEAGDRLGHKVTHSGGSATLDSITAALKVSTGSFTVDVAFFLNTEDAGANSHPEIARTIGAVSVNTTAAWKQVVASDEAFSDGDYILSACGDYSDVTSDLKIMYDTTSSHNIYAEFVFTWGTFEDPWTEAEASGTSNYSIYATYTVAATAQTKTIQAKGRIKQLGTTKTTQAKGRIKQSGTTKTVQAMSRMKVGGTAKTIQAKGRARRLGIAQTVQAKGKITSAGAGTIDYLQAATDTTDTNQYTFNSQNLGVADGGRYIIVAIMSRKAGASTTITGVTVGGVAATIVRQRTNNITNSDVAGIAIAAVPSGTTGNIVVTFGATMVRCAIAVYRAVNLVSPTPNDTDDSVAADPSVALDIPANGFAIGTGLTAASSSAAWTGLTEDYDATLESFVTYTGAHKSFVDAQTGLTITIDFGSSTEPVGVFASWGLSTGGATTYEQTIQAKGRIKQSGTAKTVQAKSRVKFVDRLQTTQTRGRVLVVQAPTVQAMGRMKVGGTSKTIQAKGRIYRLGIPQAIQALARVGISSAKTIQAKGRVKLSDRAWTVQAKARTKNIGVTKTIQSRGRVRSADKVQTVQTKGRIVISGIQTVQTKARIGTTPAKTIQAKGRVKIPNNERTIQAKGRVLRLGAPTVQAMGRMKVGGTSKTIQAKGRIYRLGIPQAIQALARVGISSAKTIQAKGRVKQTNRLQTLEAKGRMLVVQAPTILAKGNIAQPSNTRSIQAQGRVLRATPRTIEAKGRMLVVGVAQTIKGRGRVLQTGTAQSIQALALINTSTAKTISAKARTKRTGTGESIQAKGRILVVQESVIQAKGRIGQAGNIKTIQAKSRVKQSGNTKTARSKSRVKVAGVPKTVQAKARVRAVRAGFVDMLSTQQEYPVSMKDSIQ